MSKTTLTATLLRTVGVLIVLLAVVHLAATPLVMRSAVDPHAKDPSNPFIRQPYILNHVLSGVLLIPLGISTIAVAGGAARGERLSRGLAWLNAAAVLSMPVLVAAIMRNPAYYRGGVFTIAVGLVGLIALLMMVALWRAPRSGAAA